MFLGKIILKLSGRVDTISMCVGIAVLGLSEGSVYDCALHNCMLYMNWQLHKYSNGKQYTQHKYAIHTIDWTGTGNGLATYARLDTEYDYIVADELLFYYSCFSSSSSRHQWSSDLHIEFCCRSRCHHLIVLV